MDETDNQTQPTMAELLDAIDPPRNLRRGDIIRGEIMHHDQAGILISIGHKSEGLVPPHEMRSLTSDSMKHYIPGEMVSVCVLDPSNTEGITVLSLDKARKESGWKILQTAQSLDQPIKGTISGYNKGGTVVDVEGVQGFIPLSQLASSAFPEDENNSVLKDRIGEPVNLKVLEVDRSRNRVVLSERALLQEQKESQKAQLLATLHEGEIKPGVVTRVSKFGAFVDIGGADGLLHISEISWSPVMLVSDKLKIGDHIEVYVLKIDLENRRIALSLKRLLPTPWDDVATKYSEGELVTGRVTRLTEFGAFAILDEALEGLIHISELSDRHIKHPKEIVQVGEMLTLRILSLDSARHRLGLSLKQVEEYETVQ